MNIYSKKQKWKLLLLLVAIVIGVSSFVITNKLVKQLAVEERKKVELWALGMRQLSALDNAEKDYTFILEVIKNNETVPVILTDKNGEIISSRNLDSDREKDSVYLQRELEKMKKDNEPIEIILLDGNMNYIYYKESILLTRLFYFPIIQFGVISLFLIVSYLAFSTSRKAEQNQVWVGLSKETAHQLGTPTSSLLASLELLKLKNVDPEVLNEFEKDVNRLEKITERFSKIGSKPKLEKQNIIAVLIHAVEYIKARSSKKLIFTSIFRLTTLFRFHSMLLYSSGLSKTYVRTQSIRWKEMETWTLISTIEYSIYLSILSMMAKEFQSRNTKPFFSRAIRQNSVVGG